MATGHYTIIISEAVRVTERKDAQRAVEEGGRQAPSAPSAQQFGYRGQRVPK